MLVFLPDCYHKNLCAARKKKMMSEIDKTLQERGNRYGTFVDNAIMCQLFKNIIQ